MGKKGGGRKGFVKTAMTPQGEGVEPLAARDLPEGGAANPQQNGTDPSLKFLKGNEAAQSPADLRPIVEEKPVELLAEPVEASQETRGQLAQRHKRVSPCTCTTPRTGILLGKAPLCKFVTCHPVCRS